MTVMISVNFKCDSRIHSGVNMKSFSCWLLYSIAIRILLHSPLYIWICTLQLIKYMYNGQFAAKLNVCFLNSPHVGI